MAPREVSYPIIHTSICHINNSMPHGATYIHVTNVTKNVLVYITLIIEYDFIIIYNFYALCNRFLQKSYAIMNI